MTIAELRTLVRHFVNEENTTRLSDAQVDYHILAAAEAFNRVVKYRVEDLSITIVAGTQEYALPTAAVSVLFVEFNDRMLTKVTMEELQTKDRSRWRTLQGAILSYYVYGRKLGLTPIPNAVEVALDSTLVVRCVSSPTTVDATELGLIAPQDHRILAYYAAADWMMTAKAMAPSLAQGYLQMFNSQAEAAARFYADRGMAR